MYWVRIAGHPLCIARLGSRSAYYLIVAPGPVYFSRSGLGYVEAHLRIAANPVIREPRAHGHQRRHVRVSGAVDAGRRGSPGEPSFCICCRTGRCRIGFGSHRRRARRWPRTVY